MSRPPTDSSGEPLEVLSVRVPARHIKILDLISYGMMLKSDKRVGRSQALRHVLDPVLDAMDKDADVRQAIVEAQALAKKTISDAPEYLRRQGDKAVEKRVEKWMDALDVEQKP